MSAASIPQAVYALGDHEAVAAVSTDEETAMAWASALGYAIWRLPLIAPGTPVNHGESWCATVVLYDDFERVPPEWSIDLQYRGVVLPDADHPETASGEAQPIFLSRVSPAELGRVYAYGASEQEARERADAVVARWAAVEPRASFWDAEGRVEFEKPESPLC